MLPFRVSKMRQMLGKFRRLCGPRAAILLYHRVTEAVTDPYVMRVTPQHFAEHLQMLRKIGYPMRLEEFVHRMRAGKLPDRAICLTFDDGYADNLYTVKPLLEHYDVPATMFTTTGSLGRRREFWWDELERIFLQPGHLPALLQLDLEGQQYTWDLGIYADYSQDDCKRHQTWTMLEPDDTHTPCDPTPRHTVLRALDHLIEPMPMARQQEIMDRIRHWATMPPDVRTAHRALEPDEIVTLAQGGLVTVGAHTAHHLDLSAQPTPVQAEELKQSKAMLESCLGQPVKSFAYPYGLYSKETVALVRETGFAYACACMSRTARRNSNLFLLPRVDVFNWNGDTFAYHLRQQLGA